MTFNRDKKRLRAYQSDWMKRRRQEWLDKNGPCVECGSSVELEVDHIDPTQKVTHRIWSYTEERRNEELAKCQVLCRLCHLEKTRLSRLSPHGTSGRYSSGCKCLECKAAYAHYKREYRAKKRVELI